MMVLVVMGALALAWIAVVVLVASRHDGRRVREWYWNEQRVIGIERILGRW